MVASGQTLTFVNSNVTAGRSSRTVSVLNLTGALDDLVTRVLDTPVVFSQENDGFAKPTFAVRTSKSAQIRRSQETEWLFVAMERMAVFANRSYGFNLTALEHNLSLIRYDVGAALDWHTDTGGDAVSKDVRKISLTLQLSDTHDYEGGELEFCACAGDPFARAIGTVVAFPSYTGHRVTTVTRGTRLSLVGFAVGPPFK